MSGQTVKLPDIPVPGTGVILTNVTVTVEPMLPDIPVPGTGVILTNVTVTVEPMLPKDTIQMAVIDWIVKNYPPK